MPYKNRKTNYKKRRPQYSSNYNKAGRYLDTASKALAVAYAVKKLVNVEYFNLITVFTTDPSASGAVVNLTAVGQGDDTTNRQGDKIRAKYLKVSGQVLLNSSATRTSLRMMIIRDNNGSTTQPAITDMFTDVPAFRNNRNKLGTPQVNSRFTVLWDKFLLLDAVSKNSAQINWSTSLDHHIYYTGTASTDEGKGNCYLFIASSEATNDPEVAIDAMFKFIDN